MSKVILITGASKGIGLEMARLLQKQGHTIYGTSRKPEKSSVTDIRLLPLDVTDAQSVQQCVDAVVQEAGRIDVLINNAGYDIYGAAEDTTFDELQAQVDTNFYGTVRMTRSVLPIMRQRESGQIINISSIGGLISLPFNSAYAASKFALEGYSESLRYELLPFNIYVSLVEPGQIRTETLDTSILAVNNSTAYPSEAVAQRAREDGIKASLKPIDVAKTVSKIINSPHPRLRYGSGMQVRMVVLMSRLLPERWFEAFMMRMFVQPVLQQNPQKVTQSAL